MIKISLMVCTFVFPKKTIRWVSHAFSCLKQRSWKEEIFVGVPCKIRGKLRSKALADKEFPQKKVLSLVLCVAVMLSVMVMGAGAAFSDQDKIENTEAVNMCTALNIIGGYPDGSYKPEGNIKRSEITKMICVALNGGKEPNVSTNTTPTFSDVRGTNAAWAEGYIESCVAQGIISGVGGGRFSPNGNVTAPSWPRCCWCPWATTPTPRALWATLGRPTST